MKIRTILLILAVAACSSVGKAGIISNLSGQDDGDGVINCTGVPTYYGGNSTSGTSASLCLAGTQNSMTTGDIGGTFNITGDPTITYANSIVNSTTSAWTGYTVTYDLYSPAAITSGSLALATPAVTNPPDWTGMISGTPPRTLNDLGPVVTIFGTYEEYEGVIQYNAGTPLQPGQSLAFTYSLVNLASPADSNPDSPPYIYWQHMTPQIVAVPEPATLALLGIAALGLLAHAWRRRAK